MRHYRWLVFVPLTLAILLAGAAQAQQPRTAGSGPATLRSGSPAQGTPTPVCGGSWTVVTSPSPDFLDNALNGVSARTSNDVWAVGSAYEANGREGTLTEHWDGSAWTVIPSPNQGTITSTNRLYSVTAVAANDVWAVGYYVPPPPSSFR